MMDKISFLPEDYQRRRLQRRTNLISIGLFTVVMVAIVTAFAVSDQQRTDVSAQLEQVNSRFQDAARKLEQLDQLQARKQQIIRKANVTAVLVERMPRSLILAELINHMPAQVSLLELDLKTKVMKVRRSASRTALKKAKDELDAKQGAGLELPKITPTETTLQLVGVAKTDVQVAQYMRALGQSSMFSELNLVFSKEETIDKQAMRKFRIDMTMNETANPYDIKPLRDRRRRASGAPSGAAASPVSDQLSSVDTPLAPVRTTEVGH